MKLKNIYYLCIVAIIICCVYIVNNSTAHANTTTQNNLEGTIKSITLDDLKKINDKNVSGLFYITKYECQECDLLYPILENLTKKYGDGVEVFHYNATTDLKKDRESTIDVIKGYGLILAPSIIVVEDGKIIDIFEGNKIAQQVRSYMKNQDTIQINARQSEGKTPNSTSEDTLCKFSIFKIGEKNYEHKGKSQLMDIAPYIKGNQPFIPLRYLANILGITNNEIQWDNNSALLTNGDISLQITMGESCYVINGVEKSFQNMPELVSPGRIMLPISEITEIFDTIVKWDEETQLISVMPKDYLQVFKTRVT